jgi:16S rRNA (uracil1498-N3)-methyltransferase
MAEIDGDEAQHLHRVLRAEPGQRYEISDTRAAWLAEVTEARKGRVVFRVLEPVASAETPVAATLLAALIKFERFEWIVEKATELGAARIVPVQATRTEKGLFEAACKRVERWRRIAREAGQQSRRLAPPEVSDPVRFPAALSELEAHGAARCFLDEAPDAPPLLGLIPAAASAVALLIGPEGGWTDEERERALAAGWLPASLGPHILRAETAALAALAMTVGACWRR